MNNLNLTILMPCLNEEGNIAFSIGQAQSYLSSINDRFNQIGEILIVDNNSTDLQTVRERLPKTAGPVSSLSRVRAMAAPSAPA